MSYATPGQLISGEDWLAIPLEDWQAMAMLQQMAQDQSLWEAVVAGETLLTLRYDPAKVTAREAHSSAISLLHSAKKSVSSGEYEASQQHHLLPLVVNAETAPEWEMVAEQLGMSASQLPQWLEQRVYRVSLTGFQPGFAYLQDISAGNLPEIPRLASPRIAVHAGSLGFRGAKACLYAHKGPGGWPIIGRSNTPLFRPDNRKAPALLSIGDTVSFEILDSEHNHV
ncbi:carboxyltransferase domain-containing protein [Alterisphingorhabdus coralli]|uniref:Carboxyltransferase domain-containing protein n=1 Tax=Alterisphingorhabdus coralli TaxID=3071408 RepID=A0AA97I0L4_9SPHN|nr:carboxyltransferase domain-containing protein [Parasphingorhabdus sp. SCSIO 66989]WOE74325.1 carboxyltransferase domain-containing protein [Parasphingorhabdus sp. SCSIO 66989]